jgi:hypothetical protein
MLVSASLLPTALSYLHLHTISYWAFRILLHNFASCFSNAQHTRWRQNVHSLSWQLIVSTVLINSRRANFLNPAPNASNKRRLAPILPASHTAEKEAIERLLVRLQHGYSKLE